MIAIKRSMRFFLAAMGTVCAMMLTGCWDDAEINGRAFVLGFGADTGNGADPFVFTFQLAIPVSGESESSGSIEYADLSVAEHTPAAAVRRLEKDLGRQINFEQLNLIVIGEELSHGNFMSLTDYFFRRASVRRQSCVAACEGSANAFFASSSADKALSTDAAVTLQSYGAGSCVSMDLFSLYKKVSNRDEFYLLKLTPLSAEAGEDPSGGGKRYFPAISGACAYGREGDYLGSVTDSEMELIRLSCGGTVTGGAFPVFDESGNRFCCQVRQSDRSVRCSVESNQPRFRLKLSLVLVPLDIGSTAGEPYSEKTLRHIAGSAERTVTAQMEALARKSRESLGSSVLGLQDIMRQRQPDWYGLNEEHWEALYASSEITVTVNCTVVGGGITK